jgi:hypothetical protein
VAITASTRRSDVYRILDHVIETGEPVTIERNGRQLQIVAVERPSKLDRLVTRPEFVTGDPDDLVHMDWSHEWNPDPA